MESNAWDFGIGSIGSNAMTGIDTIDMMDGGRSIGCSVFSDQIALPLADSLEQGNISTSIREGFQGLDMQDLVGPRHANPTMHFSSNHLLVAAKWFHQKMLQRTLASSGAQTVSAAHSYTDNHPWLPSHGTHDRAKLSLQRIWGGTTMESPSVGSNGSKTSSPQQVSSECLSSPMIGNPPNFNHFPCSREQTEHPGLIFQARREFCDSMLDSVNGASVQVNQIPEALWHSHPQLQVPHGVLVPSFSGRNGFNQSRDPCEGAAGKSKPRVRARRGQATDPHSIAERLRRERIAERIKLLQELVPNTNKIDRAIMLDEIIEYVKFLLIQVKLFSMSRPGTAALVLPIVPALSEADSTKEAAGPGGTSGPPQESLSAIEEHVARLIFSNNVGAALQFLQRKGLCLVPISLTDSSKSSADATFSPAPSQQTCLLSQPYSSSITTVAK